MDGFLLGVGVEGIIEISHSQRLFSSIDFVFIGIFFGGSYKQPTEHKLLKFMATKGKSHSPFTSFALTDMA